MYDVERMIPSESSHRSSSVSSEVLDVVPRRFGLFAVDPHRDGGRVGEDPPHALEGYEVGRNAHAVGTASQAVEEDDDRLGGSAVGRSDDQGLGVLLGGLGGRGEEPAAVDAAEEGGDHEERGDQREQDVVGDAEETHATRFGCASARKERVGLRRRGRHGGKRRGTRQTDVTGRSGTAKAERGAPGVVTRVRDALRAPGSVRRGAGRVSFRRRVSRRAGRARSAGAGARTRGSRLRRMYDTSEGVELTDGRWIRRFPTPNRCFPDCLPVWREISFEKCRIKKYPLASPIISSSPLARHPSFARSRSATGNLYVR